MPPLYKYNGEAVDNTMLVSPSPDGNGRKGEVFYLTTHSTHFIYGYMASDIW